MNNLENTIDLFLERRRRDITAHIIRLVNIKSVSELSQDHPPYGEGCIRALAEALQIAEQLGFETRNYENHCGTVLYGPQQKHLGMFAHVDVVPEGNGWEYNPFDAVEKEGYLIGRGTNDDKGPAMAALYSMLCIRELNIPMRHGIRLMLGCNEESGMADIAHYKECEPDLPVASIIPDALFPVCYAEKGILSLNAVSPVLKGNIVKLHGGVAGNMVPDSACCVLSGLNIKTACAIPSGLGLQVQTVEEGIMVSAKGISSHAALPEGSENAIRLLCAGLAGCGLLSSHDTMVMANIAGFLGDYYGQGLSIACEDEVSGRLTHICGLMELTEDQKVQLNFNIRFPVTAKPEALLERIRGSLADFGFAITDWSVSPSMFVDPQSPFVQKLTAIYNRVAGTNAQPFVIGAATYARHLPNAVAFGPHFPDRPRLFEGQRGEEHMADECVFIQNILDSIKIYVLSLIEMDRMY
jgi:succinyl-diaminopimelate desuccinylase